MEALGALSNKEMCGMTYPLHTAHPILQGGEERQPRTLDAGYSQVDIRAMVEDLDIPPSTKGGLTKSLQKPAPTLFGGGLGKVGVGPIELDLEDNAKPYCSRYYSVPKAYGGPLVTGRVNTRRVDPYFWGGPPKEAQWAE